MIILIILVRDKASILIIYLEQLIRLSMLYGKISGLRKHVSVINVVRAQYLANTEYTWGSLTGPASI